MIATADDLIHRARERTQVSDLGPDGWQEGLDRMLMAVRTDVGNDEAAVGAIEDIIVGRLVTRLRIEEWYANHAAEADARVEGPLIVVGLPRTGTTAAHYLLAVDPQFRYLRKWEVADPVPPPERETEGEDPRRPSAAPAPDVRHIAAVDGPVEDGPVHGLHFCHPEGWLPLPSHKQWWRTSGHTSSFAYHERFLRLLQSHRPPYRWLLKDPNYLFAFDAVIAQYPSARFVFTHRNPVAAMPSVCSTVIHARKVRIPHWVADPPAVGRELLEHHAEAARRATAARAVLGDDRFLDIAQHELETSAVEVAERIYDFAGLEMHGDVRDAMAQWGDENRRGARGEHQYSADEFGLTPELIRDAFAEYLDRFGAFCRRDAATT
jgi:Sulfotransferase family